MSTMRKERAVSEIALATMIFAALTAIVAAPRLSANTNTKTKPKPTTVPARAIAHLPLPSASGSQMVLQKQANKEFLYVQKASKDGYTVIDVTKPELPSVVTPSPRGSDTTSGKLQVVGPDVAIAEIPDNSKAVSKSYENPTETVKILDLTDPAHTKVLQTFNGVTSILRDDGPGLIYLANNEGLWILKHTRQSVMRGTKMPPCDSASALSAMPPDCQ